MWCGVGVTRAVVVVVMQQTSCRVEGCRKVRCAVQPAESVFKRLSVPSASKSRE